MGCSSFRFLKSCAHTRPIFAPANKAVAWKGAAFAERGTHADRRLHGRRWVGVVPSLLKIPVLSLLVLFFLGHNITTFLEYWISAPRLKIKKAGISQSSLLRKFRLIFSDSIDNFLKTSKKETSKLLLYLDNLNDAFSLHYMLENIFSLPDAAAPERRRLDGPIAGLQPPPERPTAQPERP